MDRSFERLARCHLRPPRPLSPSSHAGAFARGAIDTFTVTGAPVATPSQLAVWHNDAGSDPSWNVEWVAVQPAGTQQETFFVLNSWLKDTQRQMQPAAPAPPDTRPAQYVVTVLTADERSAGTDASVTITLCGAAVTSPPLALGPDRVHPGPTPANAVLFARASRDVFRVETPSVGVPREVTLSVDGRGAAPRWRPAAVHVLECASGRGALFTTTHKWVDAHAPLTLAAPIDTALAPEAVTPLPVKPQRTESNLPPAPKPDPKRENPGQTHQPGGNSSGQEKGSRRISGGGAHTPKSDVVPAPPIGGGRKPVDQPWAQPTPPDPAPPAPRPHVVTPGPVPRIDYNLVVKTSNGPGAGTTGQVSISIRGHR